MHTFLFKDWTWEAKGFYIDSDGNELKTVGESTFRRDDSRIYNEGYMTVAYENEIKLENSYEVDLFEDGEAISNFFSFNPSIGALIGEIIIKETSIHSHYESEDKIYNGFETVEKIDDFNYKASGYFFANGVKISYWELKLKKKEKE